MSEGTPRYVILVHDARDLHDAKTAVALLRYQPAAVAALVDHQRPGQVAQGVFGCGGDIPFLASVAEALRFGPDRPNRLLLGTAPPGGALPAAWRAELSLALENGLDLYGGLHFQLGDDPELVAAAQRLGRRLVDLRAVSGDLSTPDGSRRSVEAPVVLTVGSDCNVGKMTVSWEVVERLRREGTRARFVATGQTGVLLAGSGFAVDRVISDFVAGAAERLVVEAAGGGTELILVEGQGSLLHPFYSGVTLGLLHGSQPDAMILCHVSTRVEVRHCPGQVIPSLRSQVELYQAAAAWVRQAPVIGIGLATYGLSDQDARAAIAAAEAETGLPAEDVVRFPDGKLAQACRDFARARHPREDAELDGRARELLSFWFGANPDDAAASREQAGLWWGHGARTDDLLRERFLPLHQAAARGELDPWSQAPRGLLALVLLLDQLPRALERGKPAAFAHDERARALATHALARGWDLELRPIERLFLYLPFEHSEALGDQERSVGLFVALAARVPEQWRAAFDGFTGFARRHRDVIARFGRFPHRNEILGRSSTAQEKTFLAQPGSSF